MRKQVLSITIFIAAAIFFAACGAAGSGGPDVLTLKYPETDRREMTVKSGGFYTSTKSWSKPGKRTTSVNYFVCAADYEIDMKQGAISIGAPVRDESETKVCFGIDGAEKTDEKTAPAEGAYPAAARSGDFVFNSISTASIRTFKDGKEVKHFLNDSKMTGDVKITSASENEMSGEINLSDGEREIKGTFSAKGFERK